MLSNKFKEHRRMVLDNQIIYRKVQGTFYEYDNRIIDNLLTMRQRVDIMRDQVGRLSTESAQRLKDYFRLKNIYHSNAIEGSSLTMGETELVIKEGLTITGKPLEDTLSAKSLSQAITFFERLADRKGEPIRAVDVRNIHKAILSGLDDENAGKYRTSAVKISGSNYEPPSPEKVPAMMGEFTDWLGIVTEPKYNEIDPLVLACTAHAWFVYIHPFVDGNGRTARLLMNLILIRNGYPLTIITKDDRLRYYEALEESQGGDLTPLTALVYESALESMEFYEQAAREQIDLTEFADSLLEKTGTRRSNEYEVYESAMRLLKGYFNQVADLIEERLIKQPSSIEHVLLKEFGSLDFDKYETLKHFQSAKRTWFFRLDFKTQGGSLRFLFFFGFASLRFAPQLKDNNVTLHVATEVEPFFYERLSVLQNSEYPDIQEIGYVADEEQFVCFKADGSVLRLRAEEIAQEFIRQVFDHSLS